MPFAIDLKITGERDPKDEAARSLDERQPEDIVNEMLEHRAASRARRAAQDIEQRLPFR